MNDSTAAAAAAPTANLDAGKTANLIYILYLVGLVVGITGIIGVVMAYINRNEGPAWVASHYTFQIRTFWIGLLFIAVGAVTSLILIGYLILLAWVVWLIVRSVKGMKYLSQGNPHPDPTGWLF